MSKTELRVFLASPGGLESERDAIEQLASTLNANFSDRLNVTVVVRRFEQLAARSGRAQAQINPWVDDCDVLIALVHRRWGSASGEGDQTGFSEEFARAIERYQSTGHPVVSLHFKAVDPESEADAGPQLAQVMAFRHRVETEHVALYANFDSLDALRVNVMQLLMEEMHTRSAPHQDLLEDAIGTAVETRDTSVKVEGGADRDSSGIAEVLETFAELIRNGAKDRRLDLDRLALFANGVARDQEVASVHLTNRIFDRHRTTQLSDWELAAWFRAYVSDHGRSGTPEGRVVPFALAVGNEKVKTQLLVQASDFLGTDVDYVQKGYLRLLSAFRLRPETLWPSETETASAHWLKLASSGLKVEALEYWTAVATADDLAGARFLAASEDSTVADFGAALSAIVDPQQSTDALLNLDAKVVVNNAINHRLGDGLLNRASTTTLQDLMKRTYLDTDVRKAVVSEIARREAWTLEMIKTLVIAEPSAGYFGDAWEPEARELLFATGDPAVLLLIIQESNELKQSDTMMVLAQLSAANTAFRPLYASRVPDYLGLGDIESYFAMNAHDPSHSRQANQILVGTFEPANRMVERLRASGAEQSVLTFVQERHVATALTYLASSGSTMSKTAINLLRSVAGQPGRFRYDMLIVLEDVAKDADIPTLLDSGPGRWRVDSGRLGRLLSRATLSRLNSLLGHDTADIALGALKELAQRERLPSHRVRKGLLRHPDPGLRLFALSTLMPELADVAGFIDEYIHELPTYYYNVVCELDRAGSGSPIAYR